MLNDDISDITSTMQRLDHIEVYEHDVESDADKHRKRVYELHSLIRLNDWDWDSVQKQATSPPSVAATNEEEDDDSNSQRYAATATTTTTTTEITEVPLMIAPTSTGWNTVHLTAFEGTPSLKWWKWMLLRVLEDHHRYTSHLHNPNENENHQELVEYWNAGSSASPFFQRNIDGHSPTNLFFAKKVHPPPWYQLKVRHDAEKLRDDIEFLLAHSDDDTDCPAGREACTVTDCKHCDMDRINNKQNADILEELRRRIEYKFEQERGRQRTVGGESQALLLDKGLVEDYIHTSEQDYDMKAILDHVRIETPHLVDHMKEKYEDMIRIKQLMEEFAICISEFWHEMELLIMAATYNTMHIDTVSDDTGLRPATQQIVKVNPPTAPFHKRYPTRRSVAVVPPPSSSDNDQTNNQKEEQPDDDQTNNHKKEQPDDDQTNNNQEKQPDDDQTNSHKEEQQQQPQQHDVLQPRRQWNVVHALAHTGCPIEIAQLAVILYPEQVTTPDHNGNLPLHICAASHHHYKTDLPDTTESTDDDDADTDTNTNTNTNTNTDTQQDKPPTICPILDILLQTYPEGAKIPDAQGRLPINLALSVGKEWESGIRNIFMAWPHVVLSGSRDITTKLHPFMLAAAAVADNQPMTMVMDVPTKVPMDTNEHELECMKLTTIYELLKIMPDAVRSGI